MLSPRQQKIFMKKLYSCKYFRKTIKIFTINQKNIHEKTPNLIHIILIQIFIKCLR